jgi:hypothetical protein
MMHALMLALSIAAFVVLFLFVHACDRLAGGTR